MGQGTWGMCEDDFDYIEEAINDIRPKTMTTQHLRNKIRWAERKKASATCTYDKDQWDEAISMMLGECRSRSSVKTEKTKTSLKIKKKIPRGTKVKMKCHCGNEYEARKICLVMVRYIVQKHV